MYQKQILLRNKNHTFCLISECTKLIKYASVPRNPPRLGDEIRGPGPLASQANHKGRLQRNLWSTYKKPAPLHPLEPPNHMYVNFFFTCIDIYVFGAIRPEMDDPYRRKKFGCKGKIH